MHKVTDGLLVALRSGVVDDEGELFEIEAGRTRIAPDLLDRCPALADFFERGITAGPAVLARASVRSAFDGGSYVADHRFDF